MSEESKGEPFVRAEKVLVYGSLTLGLLLLFLLLWLSDRFVPVAK